MIILQTVRRSNTFDSRTLCRRQHWRVQSTPPDIVTSGGVDGIGDSLPESQHLQKILLFTPSIDRRVARCVGRCGLAIRLIAQSSSKICKSFMIRVEDICAMLKIIDKANLLTLNYSVGENATFRNISHVRH